MECFDDPDQEPPYEGSDFDSDTVEAFVSKRGFTSKPTQGCVGDSLNLVTISQIKR